jgi:hypothetical protein
VLEFDTSHDGNDGRSKAAPEAGWPGYLNSGLARAVASERPPGPLAPMQRREMMPSLDVADTKKFVSFARAVKCKII